jgi:hypothetical protein
LAYWVREMSYPQGREAWRAFLVESGNPLLSTVAAAKICWGELPKGERNAGTAICMWAQGGGFDPQRGARDLDVIHRCYGGTNKSEDAWAVAKALAERIKFTSYNFATAYGRIELATVGAESDSWDVDLEECPVVLVIVRVQVGAA